MVGLVIALALSLGGCVPFIGGPDQRRQLARAAQDLVEIVEVQEGEVDWLGLRDPAGVQTEETKVLDDYVLSALMRTEVAVGLVDTTGKRWRGEELVGLKQGGSAALALGGRLEADNLVAHLAQRDQGGGDGLGGARGDQHLAVGVVGEVVVALLVVGHRMAQLGDADAGRVLVAPAADGVHRGLKHLRRPVGVGESLTEVDGAGAHRQR